MKKLLVPNLDEVDRERKEQFKRLWTDRKVPRRITNLPLKLLLIVAIATVLLMLSGCTYKTEIPIQGNHRIFDEGKKCMEAEALFVITHTSEAKKWNIDWHCETFKRVIEFE